MYLNIKGSLYDLSTPQVMGIINLTPDSFYAASRMQDADSLRQRVRQIEDEGAQMIDVGAYSSRPGAEDVSTEEEMKRLRWGLDIICQTKQHALISIDTFRADVAKMCVEEYGADIINDISAGELDTEMFATVAQLHVPYIIMHMVGNPRDMQQHTEYKDLIADMFLYFSDKINHLHDLGVSDIILDPGFGFSKTLDQNYLLLRRLTDFQEFGLPLLVGVSRKSMIFRLLDCTPAEALGGTTVVNTLALERGANILRVHDVKACAEAVAIWSKTYSQH
ncbi:MAG: dihydropteroate synthase [Prevotellaceae bacterium]|jgi:dihydropteroate synthase|nr:dihydropteroate synthase [Prevotellaceae bacterium]MDY3855813.1 dihydropteroate synthase [Bacteroidaceae bacterium]